MERVYYVSKTVLNPSLYYLITHPKKQKQTKKPSEINTVIILCSSISQMRKLGHRKCSWGSKLTSNWEVNPDTDTRAMFLTSAQYYYEVFTYFPSSYWDPNLWKSPKRCKKIARTAEASQWQQMRIQISQFLSNDLWVRS